jgi:hypothetical protein
MPFSLKQVPPIGIMAITPVSPPDRLPCTHGGCQGHTVTRLGMGWDKSLMDHPTHSLRTHDKQNRQLVPAQLCPGSHSLEADQRKRAIYHIVKDCYWGWQSGSGGRVPA